MLKPWFKKKKKKLKALKETLNKHKQTLNETPDKP
jgi:hypothetical protein